MATSMQPGPLCLGAAIAGQARFLAWEALANHAVAKDRLLTPSFISTRPG